MEVLGRTFAHLWDTTKYTKNNKQFVNAPTAYIHSICSRYAAYLPLHYTNLIPVIGTHQKHYYNKRAKFAMYASCSVYKILKYKSTPSSKSFPFIRRMYLAPNVTKKYNSSIVTHFYDVSSFSCITVHCVNHLIFQSLLLPCKTDLEYLATELYWRPHRINV